MVSKLDPICVYKDLYIQFLKDNNIEYETSEYYINSNTFVDIILKQPIPDYPNIDKNESFNHKGVNIKVVNNKYSRTYFDLIFIHHISKVLYMSKNSALTDFLSENTNVEEYQRNMQLIMHLPYVAQEITCIYNKKKLHYKQYLLIFDPTFVYVGFETLEDSEYTVNDIEQIVKQLN